MAAILVVDDEPNIRRMLARLLESEGYEPEQAADGREALAAIEADAPDVVLLDLAMPGMGGIEVLERLQQERPALPVVMMSGRATLGDAVRATKLGAFHFIEKPLSPEAVLMTVRGALELQRARDLTRVLAEELGPGDTLIGASPAMREVRERIRQVAATDARVLLTGESGTGKELAATAVHALSDRSEQPFVRVNSAAIPRDLVESEMFGHEKGAFTGATERRRGRFELADGGTLFLDEVAELAAGAQAKLLRALEAGEIERVGGERPIAVDVRVIAATNRDLRREMQEGRFREDLFYRLNVVPIHLPPLRERKGDLAALAEHLLARQQSRQGLAPPVLDDSGLDRLRRYDWPGNVRELGNICERLAILHPGRRIGEAEVAAVLAAGPARSSRPDEGPLSERLDRFERRAIEDALDAADGNVAEAARRLDTDRANLYRRMRRLEIDR